MQVSNFGGTFDQLFLWIFMQFHTKCPKISTRSCKKVKRDQNSSRGAGVVDHKLNLLHKPEASIFHAKETACQNLDFWQQIRRRFCPCAHLGTLGRQWENVPDFQTIYWKLANMLLPPLLGGSLVKMKVTRNARVYKYAATNENQLDLNPFNSKLALLSGSFLISLIRLSTVIQCSTLCTQRKVTKFPCSWCLVFGAQFQHFLEFFCPFFCYAVSSCVYDHSHPYLVSKCLCREQAVSVPAESKGAPAESKGYTLRCSGDLLCGYLRGCCGEEEKPELEHVVVNSLWTGQSITGLRR